MTTTETPSLATVLAVTSGKGGVGKTNVAVNVGLSLARLGNRVGILDADFGLGNVDVMLGLTPHSHLGHVLLGEKSPTGNRQPVSYPNFADWRARAQSFTSMASTRNQAFTLTGTAYPARLRGRTINWNFFQVLGISLTPARRSTIIWEFPDFPSSRL